MVTVVDVLKKSPAYKAGFNQGDNIISVNGNSFEDILDLIYAESEEHLEILVEGNNNPIIITKQAYEPLGLVFDSSIDIEPKRCLNKCLFCFIDQLPEGMRETLYVKDDDYRLSFVTGTYITLTNLNSKDIDRIIKYRLSPLYLSVHAYDDNVRKKMVGNPNTSKMFDIIDRLAKNNIIMHTQVVLCPGLNDGEYLEQTLNKLYSFYPQVASVAVVPVGLTKHRDKLYTLKPVTQLDALEAIDLIEKIDKVARNRAERGFAWASDELYLRAGKELPKYDYYGDFMQIENGVGLVRVFESDITYARKGNGNEYHLITGESFYPVLSNIVTMLEASSGSKLYVHKVVNNFFGSSVTVAGLLTGKDIVEQLSGKLDGKCVIIPAEMLREFEDITLDGISVRELEQALKARIIISSGGSELEDIICGE